MQGALERYERIGFRASFSISYRYPIACQELTSIIRLFYSTLPKPLQSLLFQDVLFAFRLLVGMETQGAVSAAHNLIQSVEAALPKQKKVIALKEFKQAMVALKRRNKCQQEDQELVELPQDILLHLFSFLDMQSLVSAGMVCRSWNAAASDNGLWQAHFFTYFEAKHTEGLDRSSMRRTHLEHSAPTPAADGSLCCSKNAFRRKYRVSTSLRYKNNRAYCGRCYNLVWLSNLKCPNTHGESSSGFQIMRPILSADQVAYFVCDGLPPCYVDNESSGSESSDEEAGLRLWAYPKELVEVYHHNP